MLLVGVSAGRVYRLRENPLKSESLIESQHSMGMKIQEAKFCDVNNVNSIYVEWKSIEPS